MAAPFRSKPNGSEIAGKAQALSACPSDWPGYRNEPKPQRGMMRTGGGGRHSQNYYTCIALCAMPLHTDTARCTAFPVEFNWVYHTSHVDVDLPTREGFIASTDFDSTANLGPPAASPRPR